jgi:hypothetical protein
VVGLVKFDIGYQHKKVWCEFFREIWNMCSAPKIMWCEFREIWYTISAEELMWCEFFFVRFDIGLHTKNYVV